MAFYTKFATEFFTQFLPEDPLKKEVHEETKKWFSSTVRFLAL